MSVPMRGSDRQLMEEAEQTVLVDMVVAFCIGLRLRAGSANL